MQPLTACGNVAVRQALHAHRLGLWQAHVHTLLTDNPQRAAALLRAGRLVAFPTETVYGLGADAFNAAAVERIFGAKQRPRDNPLIVHIANRRQIARLTPILPWAAQRLVDTCFPGPLTVIVKRHPDVPSVVTGGLDTLAVRMPSLPVARAFLEACQTPVAAPSANISGRPSATTWEAAYDDLAGRIACLLRGAPSDAGLESTVVDCASAVPMILRPGALSAERLRAFLPTLQIAASDAPARSPGMRHLHYSPKAQVRLVTRPSEARPNGRSAFIGMDAISERSAFRLTHHCGSVEAYAKALFDFFRRCETVGVRIIYCQKVRDTGLGRALMDRLTRAAGATGPSEPDARR